MSHTVCVKKQRRMSAIAGRGKKPYIFLIFIIFFCMADVSGSGADLLTGFTGAVNFPPLPLALLVLFVFFTLLSDFLTRRPGFMAAYRPPQNIAVINADKAENYGNIRRGFGGGISGLDPVKNTERFGNDEELFTEVIKAFTADTRHRLAVIRNPDKSALKDYAVIVHGIKGASRSIGAASLGSKAEALEKSAKEGDRVFVNANNAAFIREAENLIDEIEALLLERRRKNPKPKKSSPDAKVLEDLLEACGNYDMDKADAAIAEIEKWEYESGGEFAAWLKENTAVMNFSEISEKISFWLNQQARRSQRGIKAPGTDNEPPRGKEDGKS